MKIKSRRWWLFAAAALLTACGGGGGGGGDGGGSSSGGGSTPSNPPTWVTAAAGEAHTVAIKSDGSLWAWGSNSRGQLGTPAVASYTATPVRVGTDTNWRQIAAGNDFTLAIKTDGSLWAWGDNTAGQLGLGDVTRRSEPTLVSTGSVLSPWVSVAAGNSFALAVKFTYLPLLPPLPSISTYDLYTWGNNTVGQLGIGTTGGVETTPQLVAGGDWDKDAIAGGNGHAVARKLDGRLFTWGSNTMGQLGNSSYTASSVPVQAATNMVAKVAACGECSVAVANSGTLWSWGSNSDGQIGTGQTTSTYNRPVASATSGNWVSVAAGAAHVVMLEASGRILATGDGTYGQLGTGYWNDNFSPTLASNDTDWRFVTAGKWHTVAIKNDGSMWTWGWNEYGQLGLGNNNTTDRNAPTRVP